MPGTTQVRPDSHLNLQEIFYVSTPHADAQLAAVDDIDTSAAGKQRLKPGGRLRLAPDGIGERCGQRVTWMGCDE